MLLFDFTLVLIRNLILPCPQTQPGTRLPNRDQKLVFYLRFKNHLEAEVCLSSTSIRNHSRGLCGQTDATRWHCEAEEPQPGNPWPDLPARSTSSRFHPRPTKWLNLTWKHGSRHFYLPITAAALPPFASPHSHAQAHPTAREKNTWVDWAFLPWNLIFPVCKQTLATTGIFRSNKDLSRSGKV